MAIDWSLARIPDFAGNAYAAQAEGQKVRDQSALKNAYATYAKNPEAGIAAIMPYDPAAATQLASGRRQEKRQDTADALAAKDRERADLQRKAELGTKLGLALKGLPPEARAGYVQQQAQFLTQNGLTPEDIQAIPLDDASIEAGIAQAMSVSDYLKKNNDDRTYAAGRDDQAFDRDFKGKQFAETVRGNRVQEGQGAQRLGLEGARLSLARQTEGRQAKEGQVKLTEGQAKDGFSAKRIAAANRVMSGLEGTKGFDPTLVGVAGAVGQGAARRYTQAKNEWADSMIRLTTGAAATKDEIDQANKTYFPAFGDSAEVRNQKADARRRIEQDAITRAGPGAGGMTGPVTSGNGWKIIP